MWGAVAWSWRAQKHQLWVGPGGAGGELGLVAWTCLLLSSSGHVLPSHVLPLEVGMKKGHT